MITTFVEKKPTQPTKGFIVGKSLIEVTARLKQGGVSATRIKKGDCCK